MLRYRTEEVAAAKDSKLEMTQDGIEGAFEVRLFVAFLCLSSVEKSIPPSVSSPS